MKINLVKSTSDTFANIKAHLHNVDDSKLRPAMWNAEQNVIDILTKPLYEKIVSELEADTLSGVYATIYDEYLKDMMIYSTIAEYIILNNIKLSNSGNLKGSPEYSAQPSARELDVTRNHFLQKFESVKFRLSEYLKRNTIPEIPKCSNNITQNYNFYLGN